MPARAGVEGDSPDATRETSRPCAATRSPQTHRDHATSDPRHGVERYRLSFVHGSIPPATSRSPQATALELRTHSRDPASIAAWFPQDSAWARRYVCRIDKFDKNNNHT